MSEANNEDVPAEKAEKPIADPRGMLAMRLAFWINEKGDVSLEGGVAHPMAHAFFVKRYPLAAAMLGGLMGGPPATVIPEPEPDPGIPEPPG